MSPARYISCAVAFLIMLSITVPANASAGEPETLYIPSGGHYAAGPYYSYMECEMRVNMSVSEGGPVDLYVMTESQYSNSYPSDGRQPSVSFGEHSRENVTSASLHFAFGSDTYDAQFEAIYIVVDNRDCDLTPNDASPTGHVTVSLEIDSFCDYDFYDGLFDERQLLLCSVLPLAVMLVAGGLIVYSIKAQNRKGKAVPPPPAWPMPPEPPLEPKDPPSGQ